MQKYRFCCSSTPCDSRCPRSSVPGYVSTSASGTPREARQRAKWTASLSARPSTFPAGSTASCSATLRGMPGRPLTGRLRWRRRRGRRRKRKGRRRCWRPRKACRRCTTGGCVSSCVASVCVRPTALPAVKEVRGLFFPRLCVWVCDSCFLDFVWLLFPGLVRLLFLGLCV